MARRQRPESRGGCRVASSSSIRMPMLCMSLSTTPPCINCLVRAPPATNRATAPSLSSLAADTNGVCPRWSSVLVSAPAVRSSCSKLSRCSNTAMCRGVCPRDPWVFRATLVATSRMARRMSSASLRPRRTAMCRGVSIPLFENAQPQGMLWTVFSQ